jgi:hypothetical protein
LLVAAFAFGGVFVVVRLLLPAPAPPVVQVDRAAPLPALTRHLLLVIVDGLRYDYATDRERLPNFAAAMQRYTGGEMWAGRVTMTTSAVLSYGTGQRGNLEQVVRNANPAPPPFDTWLANARRSGLRVAVAGDPAWVSMFGAYIDEARLDPEGVAIDVDFNPQTFRDTRALLGTRPNFLVAHFVTPDHQGHAYTLPSERYRAHIKGFDSQLFELLAELDPAWTVIVTSDHGALDSGTHGGDVEVARRVPIFAYGPGIASGIKLTKRLDQADLAGTMATLLGVAPPLHSRGHVLVEWLAVSPGEQAQIACTDARRALGYAEAALGQSDAESVRGAAAGCESSSTPAERARAARGAVEILDRAIGASTGLASRASWLALLPLLGLVSAIAALVLGAGALRMLPFALALLAAAIALTYSVERMPGSWPNAVRITLFVLVNGAVLLLLLWPGRGAALLERNPALGALVVPGLLIASYTSNTQPESYVAAGVVALLFVSLGRIEPTSPPSWRGTNQPLGAVGWSALLIALVVMFPAGTRQVELYPEWLNRGDRFFWFAVIALAGWFALAARGIGGKRGAWIEALVFVILVAGSLWWRRSAPPLLGRSAIVLFAALALAMALRGEWRRALGFGLASYAWVSRDFEIPVLVASLVVGDVVGTALTRTTPSRGELGVAERLLLVAFIFGAIYVQRIGITGALDFGAMDWGAAGFRDAHVPAVVVGLALGYKYLLGALLLLGTIVPRLDRSPRQALLGALVVTFSARTVVLLLMLFSCGTSFWTALRVVGDLPFPLIAAVAAAGAWAIDASRKPTAAEAST